MSSSSESDQDSDGAPSTEGPQPAPSGQASQATSTGPTPSAHSKSAAVTQKRRRVARACDECRRKKIKCSAQQPCTHCTVYSYDCTYDQPSNRRRNPAPPQHYVEALENRLQRAEAIIKSALPEVDLDDPKFDTAQVPASAMARPSRSRVQSSESGSGASANDAETESLMESMVETTGQLDLDDRGYWDYHGHSSGLSFIRRMRKQYGDLFGPESKSGPFIMPDAMVRVYASPKSPTSSPMDESFATASELPSRSVARTLLSNALDEGCTLMRFVHQPTFYGLVERIYSQAPEMYGDEENRFLPLLYVVLALGCLFAKDEASELEKAGYPCAIAQGFKYFNACRQMIDITDCRDLTSLQAVVFMILFLQSSARLSTCYSYIGIALRSALRMGLHRSVATNFSPIERETRKRLFWVIRKMDIYVAALLGLPKSLSDKDIDQEYPADVDDEYITDLGILPMPEGKVSLMAGANAQNDLVKVLNKVIKYIYPIKGFERTPDGPDTRSYVVSYARIKEIEQDLQEWMDGLPDYLRSAESTSPELARIQQLLRMTYSYLQLMLYRPFLHYVSGGGQGKKTDQKAYACAIACVSVCRNLIHITSHMKKSGLLMGAYWFAMYTTFFSILSLVFYVLENPNNPASEEILKDAYEGKDTLASLSKRSLSADRCTHTLAGLFKQLPERLQQDQQRSPTAKKKRRVTPPRRSETLSALATGDALRVKQEPMCPNQPSASFSTFPDGQAAAHLSLPVQSHAASFNTPVDAHYNRVAQENLTPSDLSSIPTPDPQAGSIQSQVQPTPPYLVRPQSHVNDFYNFNAMMFPSADPFAYPNNPITILEDEQLRQRPLGVGTGTMDGSMPMPDQVMPTTTSYDNVEVQLYGPLPPYLMPTQPPIPGASMPVNNNQQPSSGGGGGVAPAFTNTYASPAAGTVAAPPPGFNLDDVFGNNEWSSNNLLLGHQHQRGYSGP